MIKEAKINGWLVGTRKLGKIMFLLIRQSEGKTTQVVTKDSEKIEFFSRTLKNGDFVQIKGFQKKKFQGKEKSKHLTSEEVEIDLSELEVVNKSSTLPFEIKDELELKEETRYKYRYLDLRRKKSIEPIILKSKIIEHFRKFLSSKEFLEIDTPILSQFSPEGAKTFVVPSNFKDKFYTLPQSPQMFKQILMMSGFSKYYQIAKNFRNENLRSNRQPEFLQLDIENWTTNEKSIFKLTKLMIEKFLNKSMNVPKEKISFKQISFDKCIEMYGSDKPDIRNPLTIEKADKSFGKYIFLNESIELNKSHIEEIRKIYELNNHASFFVFRKCEGVNARLEKMFGNGIKTSEENFYLEKFFNENKEKGFYVFSRLKNKGCKEDQLGLSELLGKFRSLFDSKFKNDKSYKFLWIKDWPLFQKEDGKGVFSSFRHPFTMPKKKYLEKILNEKKTDLEKVRCEAYDLVCNGEEIASGSLRINEWELQNRIFEIIGFNKKKIEKYFGYFLKALSFAAPPHGGIGIGIERLVMIILELKNLKETIAFPKNIDGTCSLTGAPDIISETFLSLNSQDKS